MSEIFDALRKAQKEQAGQGGTADDAERGPMQLPRAWLDEQPTAALETPTADEPSRVRANRPAAPTRGLFARLRERLSGNENNGNGALFAQPGSLMAEQFRLLRTRVEMAGPGTVMITSALDNEGKTSCAINLARALAMGIGRGVILIDADLRHPSTAHVLGIRTNPGLVDVLTGDADWRACVHMMDEERLRVIPAGTSSSIAPELLGSPRLTQVIEEVKAEFPGHYVVFDAPPLLLTVDPLVLARHIDHVLLVVRAGVTPRAAVIKAIESLGPERLRGIVFNGATAQLGHYYHYRDYYYYGPTPDGSGPR